MTERLTAEREAEIRARMPAVPRAQLSLHERDRADLLAELDAVRGERDERESLLRAYETAVGDVNTARDLQAKVAALRDLETAVLNGDHTCNDRVVPGAARGDYCAICRALEDSAALAAKEE